MDLCFALGIENRNPLVRRASSIYVVEYIKYDIRGEDTDSIEIVGDLFLPNPERERRKFSFIHPSNIRFKALRAKEILAQNDFCTNFLEKLYAPSLNCKFDRSTGQLVGIGQPDVGNVDIHTTDGYCDSLSRRDGGEEGNIPFTLYDVEIPGKTFGFIRVQGSVEGETLNRLSKGKTYFDIYGGEILLNQIRSVDIPVWATSDKAQIGPNNTMDYKSTLHDFIENAYVEPERYDIVLRSSPGTRLVRARRLSRDLFLGCEEYLFQGSQIDWYWSQSAHFYACSYPNGLHVGVELAEPRANDRRVAAQKGLK